jgi:hypothetical protein
MKWNPISVSAICIVIGLAGFILGKLTSSKAELSEEDRLLESSERLIRQRPVSGSSDSRHASSNRPNRSTQKKGDTSFDQKLANLEKIVLGENALDRGRAMLDWIDSLAPQDFEAAVDKFRSLGLTEARMGEYAMLLAAWAEADPISALAYTTKNTTSGMPTATVLSAWASSNPEAAIAWAKANHEGDDANPYMVGIIRSLAAIDRTRATALLQELPFGLERREALISMVPHLLKMGPESAEKWIAEINNERLRQGAIAHYSKAMANQDPAGAASYLLNNLSDRSMDSVDYVFREWAKVDSAAAIANLESLPDDKVRWIALDGLVEGLGRSNPQAVELWNRFSRSTNGQK